MEERQLSLVEEALGMIMNDSGVGVVPEDSSSDEDAELQSDTDDGSDSDYKLPPGKSISDDDDDEEDEEDGEEDDDDDDDDYPKKSPGKIPPRKRPRSRKKSSKEAAAKRRKSDAAARDVDGEKWLNREENDMKPVPLKFAPTRTPGPTFDTTAKWSPLSLFQLYFSDSVVHTIIRNTNANAAKRLKAGIKVRWTPLTMKDFYVFLAIILFSSLVQVHNRADYWKRKFPYNFAFPHSKMTRDRFEAIMWSLHISNCWKAEVTPASADGNIKQLFIRCATGAAVTFWNQKSPSRKITRLLITDSVLLSAPCLSPEKNPSHVLKDTSAFTLIASACGNQAPGEKAHGRRPRSALRSLTEECLHRCVCVVLSVEQTAAASLSPLCLCGTVGSRRRSCCCRVLALMSTEHFLLLSMGKAAVNEHVGVTEMQAAKSKLAEPSLIDTLSLFRFMYLVDDIRAQRFNGGF
ncbi:uncharacterized protein V6R79_001352 [Siganus canaliculatus]